MSSGCGSINCWGFSPSLNLLKKNSEAKNVLLVGSGDIRHVLATLFHLMERKANDSTTADVPVHIYILEARLEIYARMILQLYLISRDNTELSLKEKVEHFLEIHGNLLIRPATKEFIQKCGSDLVKMITDFEYLSTVMPFIDVSLLKYKEIDILENVFKFWREDKRKEMQLDAKLYWDIRLRQFLGTRYDSQKGAFDWDYHMRLCERNPKIVKLMSPGDYSRWRQTGIGFELREADYAEPNRTLITPNMLSDKSGNKTIRYGYWGDIVNSPYLSYILDPETEDTDDLQKVDNPAPGERGHVYSIAPALAQEKVLKIFYALATGDVNYKAKVVQPNDGPIVEEAETHETQDNNDGSIKDRLTRLVRIHFLPVRAINDLPRKQQFSQLFDTAFVSVSLFHAIDTQFCSATLRTGCQIVVETGRHLIELNNEQAKRLNEVISEKINLFGGRPCDSTETEKLKSFLYFNYETPPANEANLDAPNEKNTDQHMSADYNMSLTRDVING